MPLATAEGDEGHAVFLIEGELLEGEVATEGPHGDREEVQLHPVCREEVEERLLPGARNRLVDVEVLTRPARRSHVERRHSPRRIPVFSEARNVYVLLIEFVEDTARTRLGDEDTARTRRG